MAPKQTTDALPLTVVRELQANALRIRAPLSAQRLWDDVLTEQERQRLGGDLETLYRQHSTAGIWMKLRGVSMGRAVVEVAHELGFVTQQSSAWLLRELGELHDDPEETVQAAIASGDLVLRERPRAAYWEGRQIDLDWERRSALWSFLWELCRCTKGGQPIDALDLGASTQPDSIAKQKSRLLAQPGFPTKLGDLIRPVGRGTQKLDLPAHRIHLFELASTETLKERKA